MVIKSPEAHVYSSLDHQSLFEEFAAVNDQLLSEFALEPELASESIGPGACFEWSWKTMDLPLEPNSDAGAAGSKGTLLNLNVIFAADRKELFVWLAWMRLRKELPVETSDAWIWSLANGGEARISKSTGFITSIKLVKHDGSRLEFELERLELAAPDPEIMSAPQAPPEGAESGTAEMEANMSSLFCLTARSDAWERLSRRIEDGRLIWDDGSEEKLARVFRAVQTQVIRQRAKTWTPQVRAWIETRAERMSSQARKLLATDYRGRAGLNEERERELDSMNAKFDGVFRQLLRSEAPDSIPATFRLMDVFLRCERAAACAEYDRQVRGPLLAYFDEKFDAAMSQ
jgi:hypothetical protein